MFTVDNYKPASITSPGITAATAPSSIANWSSLTPAQQTEAEQSTVFLLTNLYAPMPTLLAWSNSATASYTKDTFGTSWLQTSYDATNLEVYALSQAGSLFCWDIPSPQTSAGYVPSQVGSLVPCAGWTSTGKGTSGGKVTYSAPWAIYDYGSDVYEAYWGDDTGHLNCLLTGVAQGDAGAGKAPTPCSSTYAGGSVSLGTTEQLGVPISLTVSMAPGTAVETHTFIGSQYGTMYRIDDTQAPAASLTKSMFCASTGTAGAACPTTNTADYAIYGIPFGDGRYNHVYWASHGTLYQAPYVGSGPGGAWVTSDIQSVQLFAPTVGAPIFSTFIDSTQSTWFAYVAANEHLYKVPLPLSGSTVYSTPLYRRADPTLPQSLPIAASTSITVPAASLPLGGGLGWFGSVFVGSGYGNWQSGGTVGAPVSAGTSTPTASGGLEEYGCTGSAANPFLAGVTSNGYGAATQTGALIDYEAGNIYFGYDTGGSAPTGGFVQYPHPVGGWSCPAQSTLGAACGSTTACVGPSPSGHCVNDSDCSGATPYCDVFPDSSFGTCVECRTDSNCPQPAGMSEVCETNNGAYACVPTARCTTNATCANTTDDPDYNTTLTSCNTTVGATAYGLCALCISNTTCAALNSATPVCDMTNASYSGFGNCVECTTDTDCTSNDEFLNAGFVHCDQNPGSPNFDHCAECTKGSQCAGTGVCDTTTSSASTTYFDTCVACDSASTGGCTSAQACDTTVGDATYDQCVP